MKFLLMFSQSFFPNKIVPFDETDPPWKNESINRTNKWKNEVYKTYI